MNGGDSSIGVAEIERLVREVLARLNGNAKTSGETPNAAAPGELVLDERLITLREIDGKTENITRLVVPVRAVVTPAVYDVLRKNNVALQRADRPVVAKFRRQIVIGVAGTTASTARLVAGLTKAGYGVEQVAKSGLTSVVQELGDKVVRGGGLAVLVSESVELALCLANRRRGVRAAVGQDLAGVRRVVAAIGANLLVVDPRGKSEATLERLAREFTETKRPDDEQLKKLLDGESEEGILRMRIAEVIGTVTLSRWHPLLAGARFPLVVPLGLDQLRGASFEQTEELVAYDDLGAGVGSRIALSEGGEAAQPFDPEMKPIDAYNAAILDNIRITDDGKR